MVVLHYTAMATCEAALGRLCDPEHEVSAHYLISSGQGEIYSLVPEDMRAWHAGAGAWGVCQDVNSKSIGIELANDGCSPFCASQFDALELLLANIIERWQILPQRVIGHSDMAPGRKIDPGGRFDWRRLALAGLSVWPEGGVRHPVDEERFVHDLAMFGYPSDCDLPTLLTTLRTRFRPWASGPLDERDMGLIRDLAQRFPVDQRDQSP